MSHVQFEKFENPTGDVPIYNIIINYNILYLYNLYVSNKFLFYLGNHKYL